MSDSSRQFAHGSNQRNGNPGDPNRPRIRQIINQVPISQAERTRAQQARPQQAQAYRAQHEQQASTSYRQTLQAGMVEVPISTIKPLCELNAFRQTLGLGPSKNLISSAIYNYPPNVIAEYYKKEFPFPGDTSASTSSSTWHQPQYGPVVFPRPPVQGSTMSSSSQSSTSQSSTSQSSTSQSRGTHPSASYQSSDNRSANARPADSIERARRGY